MTNQRVRDRSPQLLKKIALDSFRSVREYYANFLDKIGISLLLDTEMNLCSTIKAFKQTISGLNSGRGLK